MIYKPRSAYVGLDDEGDLNMTANEVLVEDDGPEPTGLCDQHGNELFRFKERVKMGFI